MGIGMQCRSRIRFRSLLTLGALLGCLSVFPSKASAQILYGSIVGTVKDPSAAAVPNAAVVITNKATGQTRSENSSENGGYSFPTLQAGTYEVKITKEGFKTTTDTVEVSMNTVTRVDLTLQVGSVSDTITVEATSAALQTDRSDVRTEMTAKQLINLPVPIGRNYQNLLITIPGFSPPRNAHSVPSNPSRSLESNVNGATRSSVNVRIDGASSTNIWLPHVAAYVPALESIDTVNVVTNSFSAEQGLAGGAAVNVGIKSGTNEIHGSGFWYNNNHKFNAKSFFLPQGQDIPKYIFNQFGGTIGGPIVKNRVFYFLSYEGTTQREFANRFGTVGTDAMRRGDLSASPRPIYDPLTGDDQGNGRSPFAGGVLPSSRLHPIVQTLLKDVPTPNLTGTLQNNYFAVGNYEYDRHVADSKVNVNISDNWTAYGRFSVLDYLMDNQGMFGRIVGPPISGTGGNVGTGFGRTYSTTFSSTYVFKPTFIVDAYFGYTKMNSAVEQPFLDENIGSDILKIPGTNGPRRFEGGWPRFTIGSFTTIGVPDAFMPYDRRDPQFQYVANANWIKGRHTIKFGLDFYNMHLNHMQAEFSGANHGAQGGFNFGGGQTTIRGGQSANEYNSYASFLLGAVNNYGRILQVPDVYTTRTWIYSGYIQDTFQASKSLTINLGLRYENYPMPTRGDRGMERYDFANNKMFVCGVGTVPKDCGVSNSNTLFAPRMGIAWRPDEKTVIRTGFGVNWDVWNLARSHRTNFPLLVVLNGVPNNGFVPVSSLEQGIPNIPIPDLGNGVIDIPATYAVTSVGENFQRAYLMSWNFTIQRQLGKGWTAQAGYVANRQIRQNGHLNLNAGQIPGQGVNGAPYFARFGRRVQTALVTPLGTTKYDSLQTTVERRFSGGLQMNVAYTWSKSLGICCNSNSDGGPAISALGFYDLNRSRTDFDRPHNLQVSGVYELPFGKGKPFLESGFGAAVLGGWQINGLWSSYSGSPFSVSADGTSLNIFGGGGQRADWVGAAGEKPIKLGNVGRGQAFYDWTQYAPVRDARFGNLGYMTLRGPWIGNVDLGIFRRFNIGERLNLQFRAEALNATNTAPFANPSNNISNLRLNSAGSFQQGVFEVTGLANTGRDGVNMRAFRLGMRIGW